MNGLAFLVAVLSCFSDEWTDYERRDRSKASIWALVANFYKSRNFYKSGGLPIVTLFATGLNIVKSS